MSGRAPRRAGSTAARQAPTARGIDTAHDRTERRHPSLTATRELTPPWSRRDVMSVRQTWLPRVRGTPRSPYGEPRCAAAPDAGVGWDSSPRCPSSAATAPPVGAARERLGSVPRQASDARHTTACPSMASPATAATSEALPAPPAPGSQRVSGAARPGHTAARYSSVAGQARATPAGPPGARPAFFSSSPTQLGVARFVGIPARRRLLGRARVGPVVPSKSQASPWGGEVANGPCTSDAPPRTLIKSLEPCLAHRRAFWGALGGLPHRLRNAPEMFRALRRHPPVFTDFLRASV